MASKTNPVSRGATDVHAAGLDPETSTTDELSESGELEVLEDVYETFPGLNPTRW